MKTNLIIVEGLPGTGKSTTASMIADALRKKGKKVICVDEGESPHPADYDSYDFPDFATEKKKILAKWREFVSNASLDTIYVFNCIFLQNPMCECMMRFGMNLEECKAYIYEIESIIKPLNPQIIYLDNNSIKSVIDNIKTDRGNEWLEMVIQYHIDGEYGKKNCLKGYEGYISCLEERKRRELSILKDSSLDCYIVSQDICIEDLSSLYKSFGLNLLMKEQMETAIKNTTKHFVVRYKDMAITTINLLGDFGMHWIIKEFIVSRKYQESMVGILLYRFALNYIKSTMKKGWKVCINIILIKEMVHSYSNFEFDLIKNNEIDAETGKTIKIFVTKQ